MVSVRFTHSHLFYGVLGMAKRAYPTLVNPWGIAVGLNSGLWVTDNHSGVATTYDGAGQPIPAGSPLVVSVPSPDGTGAGAPTGVATNATGKFVIAKGNSAGPATELFSTEDGTIAGWNPDVDATHAVI